MNKLVTPVLGIAALLSGGVSAQAADSYVKGGVRFTPVFTEDFSNFTEGSEANPGEDYINNADGEIADSYFHTPNWSGTGVYSAGGVAYLGAYPDPEDNSTIYTGMLCTPAFSNATTLRVTMRARSSQSAALNVQVADDSDTNTMDGWQFYLTEEWQTIEMVTFFTGDNLRLYIYANSDESDAFIDDLTVEYLAADGTPAVMPATGVSDEGFTLNWKHTFDYYDVVGYAHHTAPTDGPYTLMNADFTGIESTGTMQKPEQDEYGDLYPDLSRWSDYCGWTLKYPVYIQGAICLNGYWSEEGDYSAIISPTLNLSANGGKVRLKMTSKGITNDSEHQERFNVVLYTLKNGEWSREYAKGFDVTTDWETMELELTGGGEQSVIQIVFGGYYYLALQNLEVTQELSMGDEITMPLFVAESFFPGQGIMNWGDGEDEDDDDDYRRVAASDASNTDQGIASITVAAEQFAGDEFSYRLRGYKSYAYMPDDSDPYPVTKWLSGSWTDLIDVTDEAGLHTVSAATTAPDGTVYDLQGRRLQGVPTASGLYIVGGKKVVKK